MQCFQTYSLNSNASQKPKHTIESMRKTTLVETISPSTVSYTLSLEVRYHKRANSAVKNKEMLEGDDIEAYLVKHTLSSGLFFLQMLDMHNQGINGFS